MFLMNSVLLEVLPPGHKAFKSHVSPMTHVCGEVELMIKRDLPVS